MIKNKILIILPFFTLLFFIFGSVKVYAASAVYTYPNTITFSNPSGCSPADYDVVISATDYPNQGDGPVYEYSYVYHNSDFPLNRNLSTLGLTTGNTYYAMLLCDGNGFAQVSIPFVYNVQNPTNTPTPTPTNTPTPTPTSTPTPTPAPSAVYSYPNTITFSNPSGCSPADYDVVISATDYPNQGNGPVYEYSYVYHNSDFPLSRNLSGLGLTTGHTYYAMLLCDNTGFAQTSVSFVYNVAPTSTPTPTPTPAPSIVYTAPNTLTFSHPSGCTPDNYDIVISDTDYPNQGDGTVYEYSYVYHNSDFPLSRNISSYGMTSGHTYYAMLLCDGNGFAQAHIPFVKQN